MKSGLAAASTARACERLVQSRALLQQALLATPAPPASRLAFAGGGVPAWLSQLQSDPTLGLLMEAASAWWARHPYRLAAIMLGDVAKAAVMPIAQAHPLALLAGAFVTGGLLAKLRPWRWMSGSALIAALSLHGTHP